jgi:methionyl-tRNA formyltransferase
MKIEVLCSDPSHPVVSYLDDWRKNQISEKHEVGIVHDRKNLSGGDILFLVSCAQLVRDIERRKYRATLVLHASDLPQGRGWSPHIWSIVNGASEITVCLLDAADPVDSGAIWLRTKFRLHGHELLPEINELLFQAEINLMSEVVEKFDQIKPQSQTEGQSSYLRKRTPIDSCLDPNKTIAEQFDLLRVVDSDRYPAFIDYRDNRYILKIEKIADEDKE